MIRRALGHAAAAIGVGALAVLAAAPAGAAPETITWNNNTSQYTRTISNATPAVGDTITVTTTFNRLQAGDETIHWLKDWHPACLTYVTDSAKLTDAAGDHAVEPYLEIGSDFIAGDFTATSYRMVMKHGGPASTFSARYTVGSCATGTALQTGMEYLSNLGHVDFAAKGPAITVGGTPGPGGGTGSSSGSGILDSLLNGAGSGS
ncbi:hypothetical protein JK358_13085 [Nocardia sp. 2]|uniref:Uncharacterized protein n=1 Tax=Nocardia acididurans TaxID=2802282 RepID=A0ABS1M462_9NOCA|nr:hypothetical protein [Nocardia acididurans]MBL1075329.1 hypothetical protein [Nocardia acididurans]